MAKKRKRKSKSGRKRKRQKVYGPDYTVGSSSNMRTGGYAGIELKFLDTELTNTALATTWATYNPTGTGCTDSISVPAVGTSESERIGRRYCIKSILIRGYLTVGEIESSASPVADQNARVIVYWDTQTNSAEATATDIMDGGLTTDTLSWRNLQNSRRFIVLFDKLVTFRMDNQSNEGAINLFATGKRVIPFKFFKKFKEGIEVSCDNTTANVSSVSDSNIGVAGVASSTLVGIEYTSRIRFVG